jgi:hypothetical protein
LARLLPRYSSYFNPIEEAFSKSKELLRKAEAHGRRVLVETIGKALDAISSPGRGAGRRRCCISHRHPCEVESRLLSQRTACRYCPTTHAWRLRVAQRLGLKRRSSENLALLLTSMHPSAWKVKCAPPGASLSLTSKARGDESLMNAPQPRSPYRLFMQHHNM